MAYNPYYGQYPQAAQYAQGAQYDNQYQYEDEDRARGRDQCGYRETHSRGRIPRAGRDFRRDDPLRGTGHLGTPFGDRFYEQVRRHMDVGMAGVSDRNFDKVLKEAWAIVDRAEKEAGFNQHHQFPRPMPPQGAGQFNGRASGYAPGYTPGYPSGYSYAPDPDPPGHFADPPRSRSRPPPTRPYPHPSRDRDRDRDRPRARPTDRTDGGRRRRSRSRHTEREREPEPVWYVYVGTTDPDGEIIDGYDGYDGYDGEIPDSCECCRNRPQHR